MTKEPNKSDVCRSIANDADTGTPFRAQPHCQRLDTRPEPRRGKGAPRAKNWSRAGHIWFPVGASPSITNIKGLSVILCARRVHVVSMRFPRIAPQSGRDSGWRIASSRFPEPRWQLPLGGDIPQGPINQLDRRFVIGEVPPVFDDLAPCLFTLSMVLGEVSPPAHFQRIKPVRIDGAASFVSIGSRTVWFASGLPNVQKTALANFGLRLSIPSEACFAAFGSSIRFRSSPNLRPGIKTPCIQGKSTVWRIFR